MTAVKAAITATVSAAGSIITGIILDEAGGSILDEAGASIVDESSVTISGAAVAATVT